MEHVTGIGGLFFRSKDPAALGQWYKEHLGIDLVPADYGQKSWSQEAGPTVFAPFPQDTEYFGRASSNPTSMPRTRRSLLSGRCRAVEIALPEHVAATR